jgi:hypothetical protein
MPFLPTDRGVLDRSCIPKFPALVQATEREQRRVSAPRIDPPLPHLTGKKDDAVTRKQTFDRLLKFNKVAQGLLFCSMLASYSYRFFVQGQRSTLPMLALVSSVCVVLAAANILIAYQERVAKTGETAL